MELLLFLPAFLLLPWSNWSRGWHPVNLQLLMAFKTELVAMEPVRLPLDPQRKWNTLLHSSSCYSMADLISEDNPAPPFLLLLLLLIFISLRRYWIDENGWSSWCRTAVEWSKRSIKTSWWDLPCDAVSRTICFKHRSSLSWRCCRKMARISSSGLMLCNGNVSDEYDWTDPSNS